jgi:xanthine dehydrogenase YagS FAD-binding subunit
VPASAFHLVPGDTPDRETVVGRGELVTRVTLPATMFAAQSAYVKLRDRASYEFALASAAAALELDGDTIRSARVALGGVATRPWRAFDAERLLIGRPVERGVFTEAARAALLGAVPRRYNAYKIELARRAVVRALEQAARTETGTQR